MFSCLLLYEPVPAAEQADEALAQALHISRLVGLAIRHGGAEPIACNDLLRCGGCFAGKVSAANCISEHAKIPVY